MEYFAISCEILIRMKLPIDLWFCISMNRNQTYLLRLLPHRSLRLKNNHSVITETLLEPLCPVTMEEPARSLAQAFFYCIYINIFGEVFRFEAGKLFICRVVS